MTFFRHYIQGIAAALILTWGAAAEEVRFLASDGITIFADEITHSSGTGAPLLILFHQAGGDGRAEYAYAAPRFSAAGFSLLVVDQRSGGNRFGGVNRTVEALGESTGYCAAYPDLEAALLYASQRYGGPIYAAGSSYSAGLVIKLGAKHADKLAGVIAFSPAAGGPMKDCSPNPFATTLKTPTMVLRPRREMANPAVADQFALFEKAGHTMFVAENGVHGSSMLDPARTKSDTEAVWQAVLAFFEATQ